jgi:hypothetical protein
MLLTPAAIKDAFQDAIPNRRDEFARQVKRLRNALLRGDPHLRRYPSEVLELAEAELRARIELASTRVKQLINSGWKADGMNSVRQAFLDCFGMYDRMDKDPQSDLYNIVENAFNFIQEPNAVQARKNHYRLSEVQVNTATACLSDLEVYYAERLGMASTTTDAALAEDKKVVAQSVANQGKYDVFICHASEDKGFVRELAANLKASGINVWLDEFEIQMGDNILSKIDAGLKASNYGMVILSRNFINKFMPNLELGGLLALQSENKGKRILPVWHEIAQSEVLAFSPTLAGIHAVQSSNGIHAIIRAVLTVVKPDSVSTLAEGTRPIATPMTLKDAAKRANLTLCSNRNRIPYHVQGFRSMRPGDDASVNTHLFVFNDGDATAESATLHLWLPFPEWRVPGWDGLHNPKTLFAEQGLSFIARQHKDERTYSYVTMDLKEPVYPGSWRELSFIATVALPFEGDILWRLVYGDGTQPKDRDANGLTFRLQCWGNGGQAFF